jgi:DNA helicase-4
MGERGRAFLTVFDPVLRLYQHELGERIDFEDMVLRAAGYVESGAYQSPFRHILVDEFQDISQDRARLVGTLKAQHGDARVFAVGDDWQSIYRFAGADIHIMRSFGPKFGGEFGSQKDIHQVVDLGRTFRSVDKIALAARRFILQNPAQIEKTIIPASEAEGPALRVVWTKKAKQEGELLETLANLMELRAKDCGTGKVTSVLLLARYRHERPDMAAIGRKFPNLSLSFKTIHGSKGLEADHVVILGCNNGKYGFPSEVTDDPILSLVSPEGEPFQHAEERRIMYVAMTRARSTVTLLASEAEPSCFVRELVSDTEYGLATSTGSTVGHVPCSECGGRLLPVPARDGRVWYRCEHSLMCSNYMPACSNCGIGMPTVSGPSGVLKCSHCEANHHECPKCSDGWLVERQGRYGDFFGCIRYPDCTGTASVSEIRTREADKAEGASDIKLGVVKSGSGKR